MAKQAETLDALTDKVKEQHIDPLKDQVKTLEDFKSDFERNFSQKVLDSIEDSTAIQARIKGLIWSTVRDKIFYLLAGALIPLIIAFAQGYFKGWGEKLAVNVHQSEQVSAETP